jgi:hypothetical protein
MRKYILPLILALTFLQCTKSTFNDLAGSQRLRGVVVIYDTLNGVKTTSPGKNYKVYLKYAENATGYLYSTTANGLAEFSFNGIDPARSYTIYASSDTGAVKYDGQTVLHAGAYTDNQSDTLKLFPSSKNQNGIHLIVRDEGGNPVSGVTAWVFSSAILFAADTSAGRVFDISANAYGAGNRLNIGPGRYYLRIKTRIGALDLAGEASVDVQATGISDAIVVLRNTPLQRNGIEAIISDVYATPVENAKVYAYRSQYIFENDTIHYNNSLFTMTSSGSGLAAAYILAPGTYYLRAIKIINSDTLRKTAIVNVSPVAISHVPMTVQ